MRTYTACAGCGQELEVHHVGQDLHDNCPRPEGQNPGWLQQQLLTALTEGNEARADALATALDQLENAPPQLAKAALYYATQWGWPVFPVRAGHKRPCYAKGLLEHGLHEATTDPGLIQAWWERWPEANVGLRTGVHFDVIDVDPDGLLWWVQHREQLYADYVPPPAIHGEVSTPRGGKHIYLQPLGGGNLAGVAPGIDYRGTGGYVLAPPSVLVPAALKGPPPSWPLRYTWWVRPSPTLTGTGSVRG